MDRSDFRVLIRRLPGYVPLVALRFEMIDGFGELIVGDDRKAAPAASGEVPEATGDQLRAGRFVHVLASGKRRQSYSFSRIDDDRIQRLDDTRWTDLVATTEFGLRYLDMPDIGAAGPTVAVQVAPPSFSATPAPSRASLPGSAPPATARIATPVGVPGGGTTPTQRPDASPPGVPASNTPITPPRYSGEPTFSPPGAAATPSVATSLIEESVRRLGVDALRANLVRELHTTESLQHRIAALESALEQSRARERDLLDVLARWQQRG
jgi:hypothetical protein